MARIFKEVWAVDFEFRADPGERPVPVCLVAQELLGGGPTIRLWADQFGALPPYGIGPDALLVAYYAPAEMNCHLALGWPMPENVLDLYAEFRTLTNGKVLPHGVGLLGALAYFRLDGIESMEKDAMRQLIIAGGEYTPQQRADILDYCQTDVDATALLYASMAPLFSEPQKLEHALLRGRYTRAVACMEHAGIPIDTAMLGNLRQNWGAIRDKLIARIDADYGVYEGRTFKAAKFVEYVASHGIDWPTTPTGRPCLDDDTFSEQCKTHPRLRPLKELRSALGQMRLNDLAVGEDGRNRAMLSILRSTTGRNQPSNSKFVFGLSAWLRGLIKPRDGYGLAYVDWSQQEFGIAAALSGDAAMKEAYSSGDPYLAFAVQAGAAPGNATKHTHAAVREQFKACVLAVQYGMGEDSLARRIQRTTPYARELLNLHRRTYARFWQWSDGVSDYAMAYRKLWTVFGWQLSLSGTVNDRSVRNWPMQSNGSEMLRLACTLATERGISVIAPVHDAVLIEAPLDQLDEQVTAMQETMREASMAVLGGFELRSDVKRIDAPDRFNDPRGDVMWGVVNELLDEIGVEAVL
ncbi:bifunctional 3'-5' exonuclease/DNA polymerase [Comamonadaceae bacterium]